MNTLHVLNNPRVFVTTDVYSLANICRLCGITCDDQSHHLFATREVNNEGNDTDSLYEKIKRLVPLSFEENDRKPKQICESCSAKLNQYDDFISMCVATDLHFNNIISNLSSKLESEDHGSKCLLLLGEKSQPDNNIIVVNKPNDLASSTNPDLVLMVELNYKDISQSVVSIPQIIKYNENSLIENTSSKTVIVSSDSTFANDDINFSTSFDPSSMKTNDTKKEKRKFQCNICNKILARKSNLMTHIALHSQVKPHKCDDCGKSFVIPWDLTIHRHIHSGTYTCDFCKKPFITKSKLERHRRSHTGEKQHSCSVCKKKFAEKNNMLAHMSIHTGERPYTCSVCNKSFRVQSHLSDHYKVHSSQTPFQCMTCGKSFKWKSNLKDHIKYHSGEKFKCTICQKEFKVRADYYKHRKECKEEQEGRTCCFCSKTFSGKDILLEHLKHEHKDETIYQCELCEKSFQTVHLLKAHVGVNNCMNKSDVFRCDLCPMVFLKKSNFSSHFKTHEKVLDSSS